MATRMLQSVLHTHVVHLAILPVSGHRPHCPCQLDAEHRKHPYLDQLDHLSKIHLSRPCLRFLLSSDSRKWISCPASRHSFPTLAQKPAIILSKPFGQTIAKSDVESDVYWYLHSSGSTGVPKAIPHTRRSFISWGDRGKIHSSFLMSYLLLK